ncbi:MAG: glycosyltransferase family 1 protein [Sneathiellaceae bacterium]
MHLALVTDAWHPQVNGVVRTLDTVCGVLRQDGHRVTVLSPEGFRTMPLPTYPEVRIALFPHRRVARLLEAAAPQAIHIATEGPLGYAAWRYCRARGLPFTTAYHTRFPEYVAARIPLTLAPTYRLVRHFHRRAVRTMVATPTLRSELEGRGFRNLVEWGRGVDTELFRPRPQAERDFLCLARPIWLYVGRVAVEKNIRAFLDLDLPGSKLVVGGGPQLEALRRDYPGAHFAGAQFGEALSRHYAAGDVFVFPSLTDTFGLVMLEALASGVPVAAFPVTGPVDVIGGAAVGRLDRDLATAARGALGIAADACRAFALERSWTRSAQQFLNALAPFG